MWGVEELTTYTTNMVLAPKGVALYGVKSFTVFSLIIKLPIGAKGLLCSTKICCKLSIASTIGARLCAALQK